MSAFSGLSPSVVVEQIIASNKQVSFNFNPFAAFKGKHSVGMESIFSSFSAKSFAIDSEFPV